MTLKKWRRKCRIAREATGRKRAVTGYCAPRKRSLRGQPHCWDTYRLASS